jgi:hypothetical protein
MDSFVETSGHLKSQRHGPRIAAALFHRRAISALQNGAKYENQPNHFPSRRCANRSSMQAPQMNRSFLGVERSASGRAWRDRLDERGSARALAIAQRHETPELLARILAGRGIEVGEVEAFRPSSG